MARYNTDQTYDTVVYGAQGDVDGGGFMQGEVTSSPAGGKVGSLTADSHILLLTSFVPTTRGTMEKTLCDLLRSSRS